MDVALKQRLVGASVLVALGVIFIPMLLDGPPDGSTETAVEIPEAPDRRFETRLLPVNPPGQDPDQNSAETRANENSSDVRINKPSESRPDDTAKSEVVSVDTRGEAPAAPRPSQPQPDAAATPGPAAKNADDGRRSEPGAWALQLGSFGNAANAARLVDNLKKGGWNAYQEKVTVGEQILYRVRAGSWAGKDQAADAGSRIIQAFPDLDISVRQVEARFQPGGGGNQSSGQAGLKGWLVQVGSFGKRKNAYDLRDRLRAGGYSVYVAEMPGASGGSYRVRVGPELDRPAAERIRDQLRSDFKLNGIIVHHP